MLEFDPAAETDALDRFVETERGCCSFLTISEHASPNAITITLSSQTPTDQKALAAIAALFDVAPAPPTSRASSQRSERRRGFLICAASLACLIACLPPGLIAGGAIGALLGAFAGTRGLILGAALGALTIPLLAGIPLHRRRRARQDNGCGCCYAKAAVLDHGWTGRTSDASVR